MVRNTTSVIRQLRRLRQILVGDAVRRRAKDSAGFFFSGLDALVDLVMFFGHMAEDALRGELVGTFRAPSMITV